MTSERASGRKIGTKALIVVAAWTLMAAAWTPPTVALQISAGAPHPRLHFGFVFLYVLIAFVPWMALTPVVLWLARRFLITETQAGRPLVILAVIGVLLTPLAVCAGYGLNTLLSGRLKVLFGAAQSLELVTGAEPCVTVRLPLKHASAPA